MALKTIVPSLDEVPEALRGEYEPRDGKFVLKLDGEVPGHVPAARLDEFRTNNRSLNAAKDELERKLKGYDGIDPAEPARLKARIAELEKLAKDPNDFETRLQAALAPVQKRSAELEQRVEKAEAEKRASEERAQRRDLESALQTVGLKLGVDERAVPDYLRRGLEIFKVEDGKFVAKNGDTPILSKTGAPLTPEQWATDLASDAPHLFKSHRGAGAGSGAGATPPSGVVRTIGAGEKLSAADITDIAAGKAVREVAA